jgi:hypothetical protein
MEKTSRHYLIDLIEMIANDIALVSHYQELLNSMKEEDAEEYARIFQQSIEAIDRRRDAMLYLQNKFTKNPRKDYWCIVKHSIASYQFATECLNAEPSPEIASLQQKSYDAMIQNLCVFLGIDEVVFC